MPVPGLTIPAGFFIEETEFLIDRTEGTAIGDMTAGGGLAAAFDGTTNQADASCARRITVANAYVGKDYSSSPNRISKATVFGSNDQGYINGANPTVTITLYGKNSSAPSNGTDGTSLGSINFTDTSNESTGRDITSSNTSTAWDYVWVYIDNASGNNIHVCAEVQFYGLTYF